MNTDSLDMIPAAPSEPPKLAVLAPPVAPEWWPENKPPERLDDHHIYRDRDGHWRFSDGRLASRQVRRKAGVQ